MRNHLLKSAGKLTLQWVLTPCVPSCAHWCLLLISTLLLCPEVSIYTILLWQLSFSWQHGGCIVKKISLIMCNKNGTFNGLKTNWQLPRNRTSQARRRQSVLAHMSWPVHLLATVNYSDSTHAKDLWRSGNLCLLISPLGKGGFQLFRDGGPGDALWVIYYLFLNQ